MKYIYKVTIALFLLCCVCTTWGCKKFLAEKSNQSLAIPSTLADFQALLDQIGTMNISGPSGGEVSSDDYYVTDNKWAALTDEGQRRMYTWEKENLYSNTPSNDWMFVYKAIYTCNTVLSGVIKVPQTSLNADAWNNVKGEALFCRANNLLDAAIVWCLAYDKNTASSDLGLPLKMTTDFNEVTVRANVQQTYDRILQDLKGSVPLLPVIPLSTFRPSRAAAYGLLSRTYLAMRDYTQANLYADSCLALKNTILNYNTLVLNGDYPFNVQNNAEVIYYRTMQIALIIYQSTPIAPPQLYNSYLDGDLRKQAYFKTNNDGTFYFKGAYSGVDGPVTSVCVDEVYFNKAECLARQNRVEESMAILNRLLSTRWDKAKIYIPLTASDSADALDVVLKERRKEMIFRGTRWMDIKRLNKEGRNISLTRTLNGKVYVLPANDLRFALPIPDDIIAFSGIPQNVR